MNNFAIFIMVYGRPDKMRTLKTLRSSGYTGKVYFVADNLDETVSYYQEKYGKDLIIFDKNEAYKKMESGDNTGDLRSTLYSANTIQEIAKEMGLKHFMIMCDDYTSISYKFDSDMQYHDRRVKNLDKILERLIEFYEKTPALTIAFAQGGDFSGGKKSSSADIKLKRKAMNSFLCSTERPFKFIGRLNEDVTTYVNLGSRGLLFFTITNVAINQKRHQSEKNGLTEVYLDYGTYVKSFFSVMYNPSCVRISDVGDKYKRIHHKVKWNNAVPKILSENVKKYNSVR